MQGCFRGVYDHPVALIHRIDDLSIIKTKNKPLINLNLIIIHQIRLINNIFGGIWRAIGCEDAV